MPFKFNPFTGTLDLVNSSTSSGVDVNSPFTYNTVSTGVTLDVALERDFLWVNPIVLDGTVNLIGRMIEVD